MKLSRHIIVGFLLGIVFLDQGIWNALAIFIFCGFIDIDHAFHYWFNKRFTLNPFEILHWHYIKPRRTQWLFFHIPELFLPFWGIMIFINPYVVIGHAVHILMDIAHWSERLDVHSLIYNYFKK